jgi:hypothetical protein
MTVVSENAKAIRKTLADNLENECVERFVAVLFPFKVKILFMKRRRYVIIAIIFLALGIFIDV